MCIYIYTHELFVMSKKYIWDEKDAAYASDKENLWFCAHLKKSVLHRQQ